MTIRILGGMLDAIADTACTVDIEAYSKTTMNAGSADMCITDAQSINTLDFSTVDFVVSPGAAPTGLSPGQLLNIRLTVAGVDEGTPTAVVACVANASLRCAVR